MHITVDQTLNLHSLCCIMGDDETAVLAGLCLASLPTQNPITQMVNVCMSQPP